jgi:hypothetical protein
MGVVMVLLRLDGSDLQDAHRVQESLIMVPLGDVTISAADATTSTGRSAANTAALIVEAIAFAGVVAGVLQMRH